MSKNFFWALLLTLALVGCGGGSRKTVTLAGSTAFQPFAEVLGEKFMELHPEVRINVQGGGSIVGLQAIRAGAVDIAMADLVNLPEDILDPKGPYLSEVVAQDGIVVVVNPQNTISALSIQQVNRIFKGEITNWKEVGGKDAKISVVSREKGSGTGQSFEDLVLKGAPLVKDALFQDSNGTVRETISVIPDSIGYIFLGLLNEKVKALTLDGVEPTTKNIVKKRYTIANKVYLVWNKNTDPAAQAFLDFVVSEAGQKIVAENGLIPVKE